MTKSEAISILNTILKHTAVDADYAYDTADGEIEIVPGECIADAITMAIATLDKQEEQRWISVKERLPKPFVSVLACIPSEAPLPTVHESYIADHGAWVCILTAERYKPGEVTHWKPMPQTAEETAHDR